MAHVDTGLTVADSAAMRSALCSEIDAGHPVLAQFSLSPDRWAPEWTLFTGYDDGGATVIGWSFFQEDEEHAAGIQTEESGQFRLADWERQTITLVQISGQPVAERDINALEKQAAQEAVTRSQGPVGSQAAQPCEHLTWGLAAFDRWATAIEAPDHTDVSDHVLLGRMQYHGHLVGHLAAQKWYSCDCLRHGQHSPWTVASVLQASAAWATFHERMWDIWDVAGGFWRDEQEELVKFRSQGARDRVAALIRQARDLDAAAATHLQTALDRWDRSHGDYMNH
ncbi:MAG: hypothetical protein HN404_12460 [Gemmatimonadetes bacterium]|nr:hypothetical protein [Gemmatimonadota bacterium]